MKYKKWLITVLLILSSFVLMAQEEDGWYLDKTIVDIRFENLETVSENELRGLVRDYIGQTFTDSLSWEIMSLLYGLDYFDLVETKVEKGDSEGNTIKLIFTVEEKPYISDIKFLGNSRVRRYELTDAILLKENDLLDNTVLKADIASLEQLYYEKGFADIQIESRTQLSEDGKSLTLFFEIDEGIQTRISNILIEGNDQYVEDKVIQNLMDTKVATFFNKGLYSESLLQEDIVNIENYYKERGFIDAEVTSVDKQIEVNPDDGLKEMTLTLNIFEGEPFTIGDIQFQGNNLYTDEELFELMFLEKGDKANLLKFERNYYAIRDLYQQNGYIFNEFDYREIRDDDNQVVSYIISIVERERAHIENITIKGNEKTREYVIRRELPIEVGDVFSRNKLQESVMNLYNTGFFDTVNPMPYQGSEDLLMDLEINVTEGKTADILFGMTFSGGTDFPVSGQIKWSDRNFLGTGKNFGVESNFSFDRQSFSLEYTEPWLFGLRWNGGFDVSYNHKVSSYISQDADGNGVPDPYLTMDEYQSRDSSSPSENYMTYDQHSVSSGFKTGYTWVNPFARISALGQVRAGFKYIDYDQDIYRPYSNSLIENYHSWQYYDSITGKLSWDKRNLVYDPTDGYVISQSVTVGGILDPSISEYMKSVSRIGFYKTLFSTTYDEGKTFMAVLDFSSAFSTVFEKPWKSHELNLDELGYSIDGMFIGRGWNTVTGGKALWDNSLAVKFPIVPNVLAFDIFLDSIGLWSSDQEIANMHLSDFRFSAGTGIRFANPAFPIGVYWVKKFRFNEDYSIDWLPEPNVVEFKNTGIDLVVAFEIDMY